MIKICTKCFCKKGINGFNKDTKTKDKLRCWCKECISEYYFKYHLKNKEKHNLRSKQWNKRNKIKIKDANSKHKYGISYNERRNLFRNQGNRCLICFKQIKLDSCHYDHNHEIGVFRGFLCRNCNIGLGNFKDSVKLLKQAIKYLT